MKAPSRVRLWLACALLSVSLPALAYSAYATLDARHSQADQQRVFELARARLAVEPPAFAPRPIPAEGEPIGEIAIPRLGLSVVIVQGESDAVLRRGIGHLADTPLPGPTGNVVLAGHRDTFFRPLKDVRRGDVIFVKTLDGDFAYVVDATEVVPPTALWVLEPTDQATLTLVTCFPFYFAGAAPDRFIVRARMVASPIP